MTVLTDILMNMAQAEAVTDQWDEPPALFVVTDTSSGFATTTLGIPLEVWEQYHPAELVEMMGHGANDPDYRDYPTLSRGDDIVALVLRTEGWAIDIQKFSEEEGKRRYAELQEWLDSGKRIVDHPDRVECKIYTAVGLNDVTAVVEQFRGSEPSTHLDGGTLQGRVPDALTFTFTALRNRYSVSH